VTLLARLVAQEEGFNVPGSVPARRHNPGDLRHSNHSSHEGEGSNDIGIIDNDADGWADLERQLQMDAERGMTLTEFVDTYAPASENDTHQYLDYLCNGLNLPATATVTQALEIA
jgi:hypothetical protein